MTGFLNHTTARPAARVAARATASAAVCVLALACFSIASAAPPPPSAHYTLAPMPAGAQIGALRVSLRLQGVEADAAHPLVELPRVFSNVPTVADGAVDVQASDERGPLALTVREIATERGAVRQWFPDRAVAGVVNLAYAAMPVAQDAPRGAAPPIELRAEAGAVSGGASTVLLRPSVASATFAIAWDLSALPAGSSAAASPLWQPGAAVAPGDLDELYFMAGDLRRYPVAPVANGFFSAWQGDPAFDATGLMRWTETLYGHYERFFGTRPSPYAVFMRRNPVNAGGGMGMHRSFIVTFGDGAGADPDELKLTLAHEMFHTFQPMMTAPDEAGGQLAAAWFNEGLATYYQRTLPYRYGLIDSRAFLDDLNFHAGRYYTSAMGNVPNAEVPARFWADTRVRTLPYDRGFLYLATVDEAVRRASHDRRSLDDLMLAMKALEQPAHELTFDDWRNLLRKELGAAAVEAFEQMLAGATPLPGSAAFGPCFQRVAKPLRRYELGFEPKALTESPRIVRGLVPGSTAEAAGLRNGDQILRPVPQDHLQGSQDAILKLSIRRGESTLEISYLPRGETVQAWQWEPSPGARDCH